MGERKVLAPIVQDEWFDVVDECDRVIGRARRAEVHERGWRHRAVHVLVFDAAGRVFLQKRSSRKDTWPGAWDSSASGHLGCGEDYQAAAERELREELGVGVPAEFPLEPVWAADACAETGQEFIRVYRVRHEGPFSLHPDEIETGRWLSPVEVDRAIAAEPEAFASGFRFLWAALRSRF